MKMILGAIKKIIIVGVLLACAIFVLETAKYYAKTGITDKTNLIINNNNVTSRLKEDLIIEDNNIYISVKDLENFFDNTIYEDESINAVVTTSSKKVAALEIDKNKININGSNIKTQTGAIKKDNVTYLPINELNNVYNIEVENINGKTVTIDSLNRKQEKAAVTKNVSIKMYDRILSGNVEKLKKAENVIVISEKSGWSKIRTEKGNIGYVQTKNLTNYITVREDLEEKKQIDGKVNLFWDYYSDYVSAPDRTGEKIQGVNVVSPTMFTVDQDGTLIRKSEESAKQYVKWAHSNNYKVWALVSNDRAGGLKNTSKILSTYQSRQKLIEEIVKASVEYELDGVNIDFENMYLDDKDNFSRFMIELAPRMREIGLVTSVDVTAPDGSETWSLCYDRYVLGKVADYIMFMAYDQYGTSSIKAGTTAGYNWVKIGVEKFVTTYEVDSEKLILGIPFYTRIWTETSDGKVSSKVVNMKDIKSVLAEYNANTTPKWDEDNKQHYVEFKDGSTTKKMWIEDIDSIKEKISLVKDYKLGGVAFWEKDREDEAVWRVIENGLIDFEKIFREADY